MKGVAPAREDYRYSLKKENIECARNTAIAEAALASDPSFKWFIFVDKDIRPDGRTKRFLDLDKDVKCCQVEQRSKDAWAWPNDFHDAMWCTSRHVLETIEPPWFKFRYNKDGTQMDGCMCQSFRDKVLEAGFTIAHGGWAEHDRDGSWC